MTSLRGCTALHCTAGTLCLLPSVIDCERLTRYGRYVVPFLEVGVADMGLAVLAFVAVWEDGRRVSCTQRRPRSIPCTIDRSYFSYTTIDPFLSTRVYSCERHDVHITTTYHSTLFVVPLALASIFEVDPDDSTFPACRMPAIHRTLISNSSSASSHPCMRPLLASSVPRPYSHRTAPLAAQ